MTQGIGRFGTVGIAGLALAAVLVGCGGSSPDKPAAEPTNSVDPPLPTVSASGDIKTTTTTTAIPVPSGGPRKVANFPVPDGVQIKAPAPSQDSWQFDLYPVDVDEVLAFYRKALPADGYTIKNNVRVKIGIEKVHYDIQFSGKANGYIVADKAGKDVFVVVRQLPTQ